MYKFGRIRKVSYTGSKKQPQAFYGLARPLPLHASTEILSSKMAFWGVSIPHDGSVTQPAENPPRRLRITQATLVGLGRRDSFTSSFVECKVGDETRVYICSLNKGSIPLDVELEESEDVTFTVRGPRGVHLCGYYVSQITESKNDLCELKDAEDARSDGNSLRRCKCMEACPPRAIIPLENDTVAGIKQLEVDIANNLEGSQQQFGTVEKACDIQNDAVIQDAEILEPPVPNEASIMHHERGSVEGSQQGICAFANRVLHVHDAKISEELAILSLENDKFVNIKHLEEDGASHIEGSQHIVERTPGVQEDGIAVQDAQSSKLPVIVDFENEKVATIVHLEENIGDTAVLRSDEMICVNYLEDIVSDSEDSQLEFIIVERTCDVQNDEDVQSVDIGMLGEEFLNKDGIALLPNANPESDSCDREADISNGGSDPKQNNLEANLKNSEMACARFEKANASVEGSEQFVIVERTCDVHNRDVVPDGDILGYSGEELFSEGDVAILPNANPERHVDDDLFLMETTDVEADASMICDKLRDMPVPSTGLDVGNMQITEKKRSKRKHQDVKNTGDNSRNRHVDGDLVLKEKPNVEVIVSMVDDKLNDISVPSTKSEVRNIQKLEKKTRKSEHQDAKNIEDDCRIRQVSDSSVFEEKQKIKKGKSKMRRKLEDSGVDRCSNGLNLSESTSEQKKGEKLIVSLASNKDNSKHFVEVKTQEKSSDNDVIPAELVLAPVVNSASKLKNNKNADSDLVPKEKIQPNKQITEVAVDSSHNNLNDNYISSTDLEVGNMQKPKKKKRKREHKDLKNIEDDCRSR